MKARSAAGARALDGFYYTSQAIYELELEQLFAREWLCVGHRCELPTPGAFRRCDIGRESVVVVRGVEGELRAFYNVCRHRGSRLCIDERGQLGGVLRCPYHAWSYNLDGTLKSAPNMRDAKTFDPQAHSLTPVAVAEWQGLVFLSLASRPQAIDDWLAPLWPRLAPWNLQDLTSAARHVYDLEANWKVFFQNYSECYHCPAAHPLLNRLTPYRGSENDLEAGPFLGGPMRLARGEGSMTVDGELCAPPLPSVAGEALTSIYYYTLFPSLAVALHPDYVLLHRVVPLEVDRTRIVCDWLFHEDTVKQPDFDPSPAVELWDLTNRQDWQLCAQVQQGVSSRGFTPGPYADLESTVAAFDREYLRAMGGSIDVDALPSLRQRRQQSASAQQDE